ncbi:hypothetical protein FNZ56_09780 [Pseudoluteimonas lycopersici]|uniref:Uncharacterized protein n=1 Tax=Pseudoluteimonas lycopersici TaxID=1324796 RepID=A0A516V6K6_9GAMM|nr:hypothetical protein [Lysobacter lycopersici]QDQ74150.1 hypothetical protein FNZ56_09780 [Lysobacter lycopersici]
MRNWTTFAITCSLVLAGCRGGDTSVSTATSTRPGGATTPAEAVLLPTRDLHDNDLAAFARDAVPPALHVRLDVAWRSGRSRWPLDELPLGAKVPAMLGALAAPGSEAKLGRDYDRQLAGAGGELRSAALALGLFGDKYLANEGDFSADERAHYRQLVAAASRWAANAPLSDAKRAHAAIARLATAARASGLRSEADFARLGMDDSLRRLSTFEKVMKGVLAGYGLDLDATLAGMRASEVERDGNHARVRMQYRFGSRDIDAVIAVERRDGRWYVADFLRHAEAAAGPATPAQ